MFSNDFISNNKAIESQVAKLAAQFTVEDADIDRLDHELKARRRRLDEAKENLCNLLLCAGLQSVKCENGLTPSVIIKQKFFKTAKVSDKELHIWLRENGLGEIIREYVPWQTLQSTITTFHEQGNELPKIITVSEVHSIRMNGKSAFIAKLNADNPPV